MHPPLTSTANPLVKRLRALHDADARRREGRFLVEGRRAIDAFLVAGWTPDALLVREDEAVPAEWDAARVQRIGARVAVALSQASTPSGYLAAFAVPASAAPDPARGGVVLVGVADPGNCGTLLRSAAAFGWGQAVLVGGADPWSHKAVQASAGALARMRVARVEAGQVAALRSGARLTALVVAGGVPAESLPRVPRWLLIGSEAHGLPADIVAACDERVSLAMPGGVESLNAAVAGSIACYLLADRGG